MMERVTNKVERKRRTPSEWHALIDDWRQSGLSQKAFCDQQGLAISTFGNWVSKLSKVGVEADSTNAFVELTPKPMNRGIDVESAWLVELDIGSGMTLRIARGG